jgi:hypothetical protein
LPVNDSNFGQLLIYMGHSTIQVLMAHYRRYASEEDAAKYWQILPPTPAKNIIQMTSAA